MLMGSTSSESQATTHIGNRVFVGVNSIILPGVHIGSDTIIGAGSVVKRIFHQILLLWQSCCGGRNKSLRR